MNPKSIILSVGVFLSALLAGCASQPPCCTQTTQTTQTVCTTTTCSSTPGACGQSSCPTNAGVSTTAAQPAQPAAAMPGPTKLMAVGYGSVGSYSQYTHAQQKLMAMRAAQVDAYRNLAEQVYGFRIWGNTAVSAFATQNDSVRSYVDAFVRGARVVNMTSIADGNWEATVELELSPQFLECLTRGGQCGIRNSVPACVQGACGCQTPGCAQPSATYVSPR